MRRLSSLVEDTGSRQSLVRDCVRLIENEVRSKKGVSGMAVKTAFSVVKAIRPGIITQSVDGLLDELVSQIQPLFENYQSEGSSTTLEAYLGARADDVAEGLLAVTDRRAQRARNRTLVKAYQKLRPKGKRHVVVAVPALGALLDRHTARLED